jgi:hypothetical protein
MAIRGTMMVLTEAERRGKNLVRPGLRLPLLPLGQRALIMLARFADPGFQALAILALRAFKRAPFGRQVALAGFQLADLTPMLGFGRAQALFRTGEFGAARFGRAPRRC